MKKVVWGITGSGDLLEETLGIIEELCEKELLEVTTCLSKAGAMVVRWYGLMDRLKTFSKKVYVEVDANTPFIAGPLQVGKYHSLLVAPATANTVAKIVHGIADTLITNAVAQAQKGRTPVFILPCDQEAGEKPTRLPDGKEIKILIRDIDVENVKKLQTMKGIRVLRAPQEIFSIYSE